VRRWRRSFCLSRRRNFDVRKMNYFEPVEQAQA